jgi:DNA-directed RNA polymerase specialized sigma24 family protein
MGGAERPAESLWGVYYRPRSGPAGRRWTKVAEAASKKDGWRVAVATAEEDGFRDCDWSVRRVVAVAAKPPVGEFLETHAAWITKLASGWSKRTGLEFEDTLSLIRLCVIEQYHAYDPTRGAPTTWLALVARRAVSHHLDVSAHHNVEAVSLECNGVRRDRGSTRNEGWEALFGDPRGCDPADEAASREVGARVRAAVAALPGPQRRAVRKYLRGGNEYLTSREERADLRAGFGKLRQLLATTAGQL